MELASLAGGETLRVRDGGARSALSWTQLPLDASPGAVGQGGELSSDLSSLAAATSRSSSADAATEVAPKGVISLSRPPRGPVFAGCTVVLNTPPPIQLCGYSER